MGRFRLDITYDGTDFSGWARQPQLRTVCGVLEDALATILRHDVTLTVAGRTDAGVHATGQVVHLDSDSPLLADDPGAMVRRTARVLPPDVRITAISAVPDAFDARFSAYRRHYEYRLTTAPFGAQPLRARDTAPWRRQLDIDAVRAASATLLGLNNFAAFCRRREGATTIRDLQQFSWEYDADEQLYLAAVTADAFCWSMVRSLVGAVTAVGEGRRTVHWCAGLLDERERSSAVPVAPANGLTLVRVDYPLDDALLQRNSETRAVRTDGCC